MVHLADAPIRRRTEEKTGTQPEFPVGARAQAGILFKSVQLVLFQEDGQVDIAVRCMCVSCTGTVEVDPPDRNPAIPEARKVLADLFVDQLFISSSSQFLYSLILRMNKRV